MNKKKSRNTGERPQLAMTPMIDVVFQLLIFFLVTLKPEDILSHLDVTRPRPDPNATEMDIDLLTVTVYNHQKMGGEGYAIHGNRVSIAELERFAPLQSGQSSGHLRQAQTREDIGIQYVADLLLSA